MNSQCPRCLSSSFKPLIAGDGDRQNCCEFCKDYFVHHTHAGERRKLVCLIEKPQPQGNVLPLSFKDARPATR